MCARGRSRRTARPAARRRCPQPKIAARSTPRRVHHGADVVHEQRSSVGRRRCGPTCPCRAGRRCSDAEVARQPAHEPREPRLLPVHLEMRESRPWIRTRVWDRWPRILVGDGDAVAVVAQRVFGMCVLRRSACEWSALRSRDGAAASCRSRTIATRPSSRPMAMSGLGLEQLLEVGARDPRRRQLADRRHRGRPRQRRR